MPTEKVQIVIDAKNNTDNAFKKTSKNVGILDDKIKTLVKVAVPALIIGLGKKAVDAARKFETSMGDLKTLIGDDEKALKGFEDGLKDLMKTIPKDADDLGASAYAVVSAGISDTTEALKVLEASGKLAVAGLGETSEATDIMTSAINAFQLEASDANHIADVFFKAVKNGKTTVAELSQGFGQVAPLAQQVGVSFEDLLAVTSGMTTSGLKASVAYTQVRSALSNLLKPTSEMQEAFDALGISTQDELKLLLEEQGLVGAFTQLKAIAEENDISLSKMFGSVEALNAVLMLTGATGEQVNEIMADMEEGANALDEAFQSQTETYDNQKKLLKGELNVALIQLGNVIMPALLKVMKTVNGFIRDSFAPALEIIGNFVRSMGDAIVWVGGLLKDFVLQMKEALGLASDLLKKISGFTTMKGIAGNVSGMFGGGKASGGSVLGGTSYLVGEKGPELFTPGQSGNITPNKNIGGGITINITGNQLLSDDSGVTIGDMIVNALKQEGAI